MKKVLLAVSGGIAVYKACDIVSKLTKRNVDVQVIMTENATKFVTPLTFEALSSIWCSPTPSIIPMMPPSSTLLAQRPICSCAPATANIMAKMAHGIADDMVSSTFLAATCPVLVCPAMNTNMYENAATQANLRILEERGMKIVGPGVGKLACGDIAKGVLAPVDDIVDAIMETLGQ
ncbi:MAG: flavoprotein [Slackia sp.]